MAKTLEELLEEIDPRNTIDVLERRLNQVFESFDIEKNILDTDEECELTLVDLMVVLYKESGFLKKKAEIHKSMAQFLLGEAFRVLGKEFPKNKDSFQYLASAGTPYGYTKGVVYEIMQSGTEGGVYSILSTLTKLVIVDRSETMIKHLVEDYLDNKEVAKKFTIAEKYVEKYRHILPAQITEGGAIPPWGLTALLENHPWMLKSLRH